MSEWATNAGLRVDHAAHGSAVFSADDRYRYELKRFVTVDAAHKKVPKPLVVCGLNPSTADAFKNDPTVTRECGFTWRWGCDYLVKVNAYAWRATLPVNLWRASGDGLDVVGQWNDAAILAALCLCKRDGGIALAAWGNHARPERVQKLVELAREAEVTWMCIKTNKDGSPTHPLYQPNDSQPKPWGAS